MTAVLAAGAVKKFKSDLHPRGPNGRFTKSFTKALTVAERKRADNASTAFKAVPFDGDSLKAWKGEHTAAQLAAIGRYVGGDWKQINADLRAGKTSHDDVADLDAAMHPLPHDVLLHRDVPLNILGTVNPEALVGRKVKDAAYVSTTAWPTGTTGPVVRMHIAAPAGTPALPTGQKGEVLLPRDTEMAVESVKADGHGGYDMNLIVVPKARTRAPAKKAAPAPKADEKPPATKPAVHEPKKTAPAPVPPKAPAKKAAPKKTTAPKKAAPKPAAPARAQEANLPATGPGGAELAQFIADAEHGNGKTTTKLAGGLSADTSLVRLADGRAAVHKRAPEWGDPGAPKTQADAEYLASLVASQIGAPVPSVARDGSDAVWMHYIPGRTAGQVLGGSADDIAAYRDLVKGPDGVRLGLLDALTINADRNDGNLLLSDDGRLHGIDHGFAFGMFAEGTPPNNLGGQIAGRPIEHFVTRQGNTNVWVDNELTADDVAEVRQRLEALRPQFEALGRSDWLDKSHKMLDALASHAKGETNLVAGVR